MVSVSCDSFTIATDVPFATYSLGASRPLVSASPVAPPGSAIVDVAWFTPGTMKLRPAASAIAILAVGANDTPFSCPLSIAAWTEDRVSVSRPTASGMTLGPAFRRAVYSLAAPPISFASCVPVAVRSTISSGRARSASAFPAAAISVAPLIVSCPSCAPVPGSSEVRASPLLATT